MIFENIRVLREDRDIKQYTLANLLNIAQNTYSQYETGKIEWTATMLIKLANFYETSVDYLLGLVDKPNPYFKGWLFMLVKDYVVKRFVELCKQNKISLNKLARNSGVSPSTVYSMTKNTRREIGITTIKILCDGLDISSYNFFNTDEFKNLEQEIK